MKPDFIQRVWNHVFPAKPGAGEDVIFLAGPATRPTWWDPSIHHIPWPAWLPRQLYITHARLSHQVEKGPYTQSLVSIDYGARCLRTSLPPWYQQRPSTGYADWSNNANLVSLWPSDLEPHDVIRHWGEVAPFFFNADEDILWCQLGGTVGDVWFFNLGFLVPAPCFEVQELVEHAPSGLTTTMGPVYTDVSSEFAGYTFSSAMTEHWVEPRAAGTETHVVFRAGASQCVITDAFIGARTTGHETASMQRIMFDGTNPAVIIPAGTNATGIVPAGIDGSNGYVVRGHVGSGTVAIRSHSPVDLHTMGQGWSTMNTAGNYAASASAVGFTAGTAATVGVVEVKQRY